MSHRIAQIESTLKRAVAQVLIRRVSDPRIVGMVSVTRVEVTPDMREATAYVSVLPEKYQARTIAGLQAAHRHIQSMTGKLVSFDMPHLRFKLDEGLKKEAGVLDAIREGTRRTGPPPPESEAPEAPPPEAQAPEADAPEDEDASTP